MVDSQQLKSVSYRLLAASVLAVIAFFLLSQATHAGPGYAMDDVSVVEGTVVAHHKGLPGDEDDPKQAQQSTDHTVTLADRPQNVGFVLRELPATGIASGAQVRLEVSVVAERRYQWATDHPDSDYPIFVVGATVNGETVYSAAEEVARARATAAWFGFGGAAVLLAALGWAAVVVRGNRPAVEKVIGIVRTRIKEF